jgi:hypothetical protein
MQATLALPGRTITYPLTEGFTETFTEGSQLSRLHPKSPKSARKPDQRVQNPATRVLVL